MKKILMAILFAITLALPAFTKAPLSYIENGAWAFYTDNRSGKEVYRGYLVVNDDETDTSLVYLRVVTNPKKPATDIHYAVEVIWDDDKEPALGKIYNIQGFTEKHLNDQITIQSAVDILNFDLMYQANKKVIGYDSLIDDPWDENIVLQYHFNKALPGFRFDSINVKGSTEDYIKVDRFYIAKNDDGIQEFFKTTKWSLKTEADNFTFAYPEAKAAKVKLSGITYNIDENWTHMDASDSQAEHYVLSKYSPRDAAIIVEDVSSWTKIKTEDDMIYMANILITFKSATIVPGSIKASYVNKALLISYVTVDTNNNNIKTIEMYKITNKAKIIELYAFEKCYLDNQEYFDKIIQTAK